MALGTDTGGSVRIPAALCGVTGLKTTVGQVSRSGICPLSKSLDSVGPLCRSVADAALVYDAIQGPDPEDPSTRGGERLDVRSGLTAGVAGMRLAFPETAFWEDADAEVTAAVRTTGEVFRSLGASVESIEFPEAGRARALNPKGLVIAAEAYAVNRSWVDNHLDALDPVVGTRLLAGRDISAADYLATVRRWEELRVEADRTLTDFDGLLCPTTPIPAVPLADVDIDLETYLGYNLRLLRNTTIGNILGLCGLSVPCGQTRSGLHIGLMIYGPAFSEDRLLRIGYAFQAATDWHRVAPPID
jgi:aspartyl-tRNA(Asn)/glutamyl-tRNA(Gln) amidotransferase subunit A